jgi:hypothetical protein
MIPIIWYAGVLFKLPGLIITDSKLARTIFGLALLLDGWLLRGYTDGR